MKRGKMLRLGILTGLLATGLGSTGCTTPSGATNNTGTDALAGGASREPGRAGYSVL